MKRDEGFHEYIMNDIFISFAGIKSRAMFGGWGIYKNGIIFAIIADGTLYFKVDESNKDDYLKNKSKPFTYTMPSGKKVSMSYWELPQEIMEDQIELEKWIAKSIKISQSKKKLKKHKK